MELLNAVTMVCVLIAALILVVCGYLWRRILRNYEEIRELEESGARDQISRSYVVVLGTFCDMCGRRLHQDSEEIWYCPDCNPDHQAELHR